MKRALPVIDVQNEYCTGKLSITYPDNSMTNILNAMNAAQEHCIPVIVVQHAAEATESPVFRKGSLGWQLRPDIISRPFDLLIEKDLLGSFTGTRSLGNAMKRITLSFIASLGKGIPNMSVMSG